MADPAGERLEAVSGGLFAASGARAPKVIDVTPVNPVEQVLRTQRAAITNRELAQLAGI